ncbi:hypothetical protein MMC14_008932 [Varicellaria rhodocarpa]|nr:hypothetical protein [Varicellaria rhodocarpa]
MSTTGFAVHAVAVKLIIKALASAESVIVSVATANGLGKHSTSLTSSQLVSRGKAVYAAALLTIVSYCFAKLSLVAFLRYRTPSKPDQRNCKILGLVIIAWATTAFITTAFQCHLPRPWDSSGNSCLNRNSLADYVAIVNILTDAALIVLPLIIVTRLKAKKGKKVVLSLVFFGRASVIAVVAVQLVYLGRIANSKDPTFDVWPVAFCIQIAQCLSIFTACTFYLKPFIDGIESGFIRADDLRRQHVAGFGYTPAKGSGGCTPDKGSNGSSGKKLPFSSSSSKPKLSRDPPLTESIELRNVAKAHLGRLGQSANVRSEPPDWDAHSQSHILRTTTLSVQGHH